MSKDYDFIHTSKPIDATAANVLRPGVHYDVKKNIQVLHWDIMPPPQRFMGSADAYLVGKSFGRFTVVGYYGRSNKQALWIVRCSCGKYTIRRSKAIKNPKNNIDRCDYCRDLLERKNHDYYRQTGKDLPKKSQV